MCVLYGLSIIHSLPQFYSLVGPRDRLIALPQNLTVWPLILSLSLPYNNITSEVPFCVLSRSRSKSYQSHPHSQFCEKSCSDVFTRYIVYVQINPFHAVYHRTYSCLYYTKPFTSINSHQPNVSFSTPLITFISITLFILEFVFSQRRLWVCSEIGLLFLLFHVPEVVPL